MKKLITAVVCIAACAQLFTGCSRRNNENSKTDTAKTTTTKIAESTTKATTDHESSRGVANRVEEGINDTISGGKDIIDDTLSTAESVVDDIIG
ncbi:MAG: hypothetical protein ACI4I6_01660 [Hominimerdicola sp.]